MLDAVSRGLHPSAFIPQLAEKYAVSERALWSDWQRRKTWVPVVLGLEEYSGFCNEIKQRLNAVQKAAWRILVEASNDSAKVGALRTVLETLKAHAEIVQVGELVDRLAKLEEAAQARASHPEAEDESV